MAFPLWAETAQVRDRCADLFAHDYTYAELVWSQPYEVRVSSLDEARFPNLEAQYWRGQVSNEPFSLPPIHLRRNPMVDNIRVYNGRMSNVGEMWLGELESGQPVVLERIVLKSTSEAVDSIYHRMRMNIHFRLMLTKVGLGPPVLGIAYEGENREMGYIVTPLQAYQWSIHPRASRHQVGFDHLVRIEEMLARLDAARHLAQMDYQFEILLRAIQEHRLSQISTPLEASFTQSGELQFFGFHWGYLGEQQGSISRQNDNVTEGRLTAIRLLLLRYMSPEEGLRYLEYLRERDRDPEFVNAGAFRGLVDLIGLARMAGEPTFAQYDAYLSAHNGFGFQVPPSVSRQ